MDKAKKGRTTIVIAHRLSTVRHSDKIVAVREGRVEEVSMARTQSTDTSEVFMSKIIFQKAVKVSFFFHYVVTCLTILFAGGDPR